MFDFFVLLIVCFFAAVIGSSVICPLFKEKLPDIQQYAGPVIITAFVVAVAVGIMFIRQDKKNVKSTQESAYKEGYEAGYKAGKEDGYLEASNEYCLTK